MTTWQASLAALLVHYASSFSAKEYEQENNDTDILMDVFGITPELKRENRQYWGRELGMCWQLLVTQPFQATCNEYGPPYRDKSDGLCDLTCGGDAIDTKYRIGSGDSGTLKKFRQ